MIEIEVDGIRLTEFISARVTRSIATASGSFSVKIPARENQPVPIKVEQKVLILIDGCPAINGFIESVNIRYDSRSHSIDFSGRDRTADFIDSSVNSSLDITPPITLAALLQVTLANMGLSAISVIDDVSPEEFGEELDISAEIGQTGFEFIEPFSRARQVLLTSDGQGNLRLVRAGTRRSGSALVNKIDGGSQNNILSGSFSIDNSNRFNKYIAKSQDVFSGENVSADPADGIDNEGEATDSEIRTSRVKIFEAEENMDSDSAGRRAAWDSNLNRAKAKKLSVQVQGHNANGVVWEPNQLARVADDFSDIQSDMLIEQVEYQYDNNSGSTTNLSLVPPDSYLVQAEVSAEQARLAILGDDFQ